MGGQLACRQVTPGKLGCALQLRVHTGPGKSVRASVLLSRVLMEAGVAPAVHLRGPAPRKSDATRRRVERGKSRESSAEVSRHHGFDECSAQIFDAGSLPHSREIREAGEIREDPDSASKRQQWTTDDEDSVSIEEYVEWFNSQDKYSAMNDSVRSSKSVSRPHCASMAHRPRALLRGSTGDGRLEKVTLCR